MLESEGAVGCFLLAVIVIVIAAKLIGALATRLGQPAVIGELLAGLILGPTVLGRIAAPSWEWLFSPTSTAAVNALAQLAVVLFIFSVGLSLPLDHLRAVRFDALVVGCAAFLLPFGLGVGLAVLFDSSRPAGVSFAIFAAFFGVAMSVTAFPVLARVLQERGIASEKLGVLGLAAAGVIDVVAWLVLAGIVTATGRNGTAGFITRAGLAIGFGGVLIFLVRPMLTRVLAKNRSIVIVLTVGIGCASITDLLGLHTIFGAFAAGLIMPRGFGLDGLNGFVTHIGLPAFFTSVGLTIDLYTLANLSGALLVGAVLLCAIIGKFVGAAMACLALGLRRTSIYAIGAMMNCRGLTELVMLSAGYSLGLINRELFGAFVVMALVTTAMTGPLLSRLVVSKKIKKLLVESI